MKRFLQKFLFLFLILPTTLSFSQVSLYTFSETVGTYTPIVGGTQLATTTGGATSFDTDGNNIPLPLGSRFTFNGVTITSVNMTADGALWLNPLSTTTGNGTTGPISSTATAAGIIAGMAMDLRSTAIASQVYERRWEDVGTEVVFQWQNVARYRSSNPFVENERFSFQIRINKTTGVVQVVYGNMTTITTSTSYQPMVGLRGSTNTDYNNRRLTTSVPDVTPNWGAPNGTTAGTSNAHNCRFTTGSPSCIPTSGLIFIWTPPSCSPPTSLTITYTSSTSANLSWTVPTSAPSNGYEWEIRTSGVGGSGSTGLVTSGSVGAGITTASTSLLSSSTTYTLYVRSNCGGTYSTWAASSSSTSPVAAPSNDACFNATSLPCGTSSLAGTTIGSVSESAPLGLSSSFGVWYSFVGDGNSTTISAYANIDLGLLIMTGSGCSGFSSVVYMDNWGTFSTESFTFTTTNSQVYYVYIAHYLPGNTTTGTFTISRTCTTPCNTTPSTISVNLSSTIANDIVTYTVTGGNGSVTGYEYSFNNFSSVAGTFTTTNNPWNLRLNTTQSIIYVRAITQNGTCNSVTSNIVSTTIGCATPFIYATEFGDYITNVTFNTINNTSTRDNVGDGYQNFLSLSTNVCKGFPYTISVSSRNNGGYLGYRVWIDWNNDGDFVDGDESVFSAGPQATATGTITIPNTATNGNVKMRVVGAYNTTPPNTPCSTTFLDYGEYEEYTINIGTFTMATSPVNTDMVFVGRTSNVFNTITNWLQYNGTGYVLATAAPNATTNVILPPNQTCATTPLTIAANINVEVKSITIENTAELRINGTMSVFKDFLNYGSVINTNTTSPRMIEFVGSSTQDVLVMQGNNTLYNLRINKPSGEVRLDNNINITNSLSIPSGFFNLNQKYVDLGTTGSLSNEGTNHSTYCDCSQSYVQSTTTIGSNVVVTPGNMGLELTTNGNQMGTTIIKRKHQRAGSTGISNLFTTYPSVYRIFEVTPQFNGTNYPPNGLNVDINFTYLDHEVGTEIVNDEISFALWRSGDNGTTWEEKGGTIDATNNKVTYNGFSQFSWISVGPSFSILPLNLLSFNGITEDKINKLNWVTDNEVNVSHFELEKSGDGINFEVLTNIPSYQLSSVRNYYNFNDVNPLPNITYYRLTTVDFDGTTYKSNVIALDNDTETQIGVLYPNPTNDIIKYNITSAQSEKIEVKILDVVGKVVLRKEFDLEIGNNSIPISLSELPNGTYTIQVKHLKQMVTNSTKVIKL